MRKIYPLNLNYCLGAGYYAYCIVAALLIQFILVDVSRSQDQAAKDFLDVVLLLDSSASMRITDPERLRDEGAKLILQFLNAGDRLAVIEFDGAPRTLRPLTTYHPVQDKEIESVIRSVSDQGIYTDLVRGVLSAKRMLEENERPEAASMIILLSDGHLEPDPEFATAEGLKAGLIYGLLPELKQKNIILHTIALSTLADKNLLQQMAQATDGTHWYSEKAEQVHEAFAKLFMAAKKPQTIPMTTRGFRIDGEVEEATFYINTEGTEEEVTLSSPSGNIFSADSPPPSMRWYRGQQFDTVTIDDPEVGNWRVLGVSANKGFATVLTNLKLITDWPSSIIAGNKRLLRARLYEDDKPIVLPIMTREITYAFQIVPTDRVAEPVVRSLLRDDGTEGDEQAGDGIFSSNVLIEEAGDYQLKVLARGPTFERQQTISFKVRPRLVNLSLVAVEDAQSIQVGVGATKDYFRVTLNPEIAKLKNISVQLIAKDKAGKLYNLDLQKRSDGSLRYEVPAAALIQEGEYELQATVSGESKQKRIRGTSQLLQYKKTKATVHEKQVITTIVMEEKKVESSPPVLLLSIFILMANLGTAAFCLMRLKSSASSSTESIPDPEIPAAVLAAMESIKEQAEQTEVDLEDPRLSGNIDNEIPIPPTMKGDGNIPDAGGVEDDAEQESDSTDES